MEIKRLLRGILVRCLQAARSEEALRIRERALQQTTLGQRCVFDSPKVGWQFGAALILGDDVVYEGEIGFLRENARVEIGARSYFAGLITCAENIRIGSDVLIAKGGFIADHGSHAIKFQARSNDVLNRAHGKVDFSGVRISPVTIQDKAWIGWAAVVMPGVTVGEGAIVGANSVVTDDVAPYTLVAGNPARFVRNLE